jgi:hypothetical protein
MLKWLNLVQKYGFCFVTGSPVDPKVGPFGHSPN